MEKQSVWLSYYQNRKKNVRSEVVKAIKYVANKNKKYALDLGSGNFEESAYLLQQGFSVVAVDPEKILLETAFLLSSSMFYFECVKIEEYDFPKDFFDFVCANYSLPWVPKESMLTVFEKIRCSLKDGGIFCFQLFGDKDDWSFDDQNKTSFYSESEIMSFIKNFKIVDFKEVNKNKKTVRGTKKYWHIYDVIVKK